MATCRGITLRKGAVIKANLNRPHDVICQNGFYIVTDIGTNRIVAVSPEDNSFDIIYEGGYSFHPYGIAALSDDKEHYLITDDGRGGSSNGCVYELKKGTLQKWASHFKSFRKPTGIAICEKEVFVADWGSDCIYVFNMGGEFLRSIGESRLNEPWFLAFNSQNLLYIADLHCIRVFRTDGSFQKSFKIGTANKFWHYRGIAFDALDNVYITARSVDSKLLFTKETLSVLDKNHKALDNIAGGWRTFNYLRGLCFDKAKGRIVVVDGEWHELKLFNLH